MFREACEHARRCAVLGSVESLLGWDEQTMMPPLAAEYRGEQAAAVAAVLHARRIDPAQGERLARLADGPLARADARVACTIRRLIDDFNKRSRLPVRLVEELARTCVQAQAAWVDARRSSDWKPLAPWIDRVFRLKREQGEHQLPDRDAYDALMDDYEPGARWRSIASRFDRLRERIVPLAEAIRSATRRPDDSILHRLYPRESQERFVREVAKAIGFDFHRGRLDTTEHPFCSTVGPHDCRITTRWDERDISTALYGVLHEAGHGLYEQGLDPGWYGLPPGESASLGIHESQSRLWENLVGRSRAFWQWCFPLAARAFPAALEGVSAESMHEATLVVRPSFIRVEADEVTYNLHVMMRFDLERAVVLGDLAVNDLPEAWNTRFERDFGLRPKRDSDGVIQDIHWSAGLVGYFPTYTLGTMHAAQLMAAARRGITDLDGRVARGEFSPLLDWLRTAIHARGRMLDSDPLVTEATGEAPGETALIESLVERYTPAYGLDGGGF